MRARSTWTAFAPSLHVCEPSFIGSCKPLRLPDDAQALAARQLRHEGYLQLSPPDWTLPLSDMADVVRRLVRLGAPPVLAYHFDEFWMMFGCLSPLLAALLGDDPIMLPAFWTWHIDPNQEDAGWAPHRDRGHKTLREDGSPKVVTVWLPLTDATPLNGCMYIVPADRDPTYGTADESQMLFKLTDIRALPASAGSILSWDQAVLHWGSHAAARDIPPRISIGGEFQRRDIGAYEEPLLDPRHPPDFATRQVLIGRQILRYQHMIDPDAEWAACAEHMARGTL